MKSNIKEMTEIITGVSVLFGIIGFGYSIRTSRKMDEVCLRLNTTVDDIVRGETVQIPEYIIQQAVDKAVDRRYEPVLSHHCVEAVHQVRNDIRADVKEAVSDKYKDISDDVEKEMRKQAQNIDFNKVKEKIISETKKEIEERLKDDIDEVVENYNKEIRNVSDIYSSIFNTLNKDAISLAPRVALL